MTALHNASLPLVLITGASSGIGQQLAAEYLRQGWRVALVARSETQMQDWVSAQPELVQRRCWVGVADVRDPHIFNACAIQCLQSLGLPQVVVANAGISCGIDASAFDDLAVLRTTLETNVLGLAATFQPFIEPMRQRGSGTLVGIASVTGIRGLPGHGAYCASKAAAISYCESLRIECRGSGVRVVTLLPGYVDTPLTRKNRYPMPFLLSTDAFARRAYRQIEKGSSYSVIPWPMSIVSKILKILPNALLDPLLARLPRKHRHNV